MSFGRVVLFENWRQNLKCLFTFLFFAGSKRRMINFIEITQPFLYLEGAPKYISQQNEENTTTKIFRYSTPISTFNALSK